jgi:D-xylonolactonase
VERCLYWIDIEGDALWRADAGGQPTLVRSDAAGVGALTLEADGRILLFLRNGELFCHPDGERLASIAEVAGSRFNDAVCDRSGRVYCGVMPAPGRPGRLLRLEAGRAAVPVADPWMPNGCGLSPDGRTLYFTDTLRRSIHAAPFDESTGTLGRPRVFARAPRDEGLPDGLTVDRDGGVWSARHGAALLVRYDAAGAETHRFTLPTSHPTGLTFGGDDLDELYVATAQAPGGPGAGALYRLTTGFRGQTVRRSRLAC